MADEGKLHVDVSRARKAQELLDNELFNEAHAKLEADLIAAWVATPARDTDGRERCWAAVQANRKHKDYFVSILNDGKMAAADLKQIAETAERRKRFGVV